MEKGISIEEACKDNLIGTEEDFQANCNPDGTVKQHPKTTTFTLKNDETKSVTIDNTYLYLAGLGFLLLVAVAVFLIIRRLFKKKAR